MDNVRRMEKSNKKKRRDEEKREDKGSTHCSQGSMYRSQIKGSSPQ